MITGEPMVPMKESNNMVAGAEPESLCLEPQAGSREDKLRMSQPAPVMHIIKASHPKPTNTTANWGPSIQTAGLQWTFSLKTPHLATKRGPSLMGMSFCVYGSLIRS